MPTAKSQHAWAYCWLVLLVCEISDWSQYEYRLLSVSDDCLFCKEPNNFKVNLDTWNPHHVNTDFFIRRDAHLAYKHAMRFLGQFWFFCEIFYTMCFRVHNIRVFSNPNIYKRKKSVFLESLWFYFFLNVNGDDDERRIMVIELYEHNAIVVEYKSFISLEVKRMLFVVETSF